MGSAAAISLTMSWTGLLLPVDAAFYDRVSLRLPAVRTMPETVVVAIDDPSFAELGQSWPWPRSLHARLIEALRTAGARQIAYDVVFADPGTPADDAALAQALNDDVILARYTSLIDTEQGALRMSVAPLPLLANLARVADVDIPVDPDGAIRRLSEGAGTMAATLAGQVPPPGARIRFEETGLRVVSFYQALEADRMLPPGTFLNKSVLVGTILDSTPATSAEMFRVPATADGDGFMAGVVIHAHAYRTIAPGRYGR